MRSALHTSLRVGALALALFAASAFGTDERARAARAIAAAKNAIQQVDAGEVRKEARQNLADAQEHFAKGRYREAAQTADAAWRRVRATDAEGTKFSVEVDERGTTEVVSTAGQPVRVEAQGVQRAVGPGKRVKVARGSAPPEPRGAPEVPVPQAPKADAVVELAPGADGKMGPVTLSWAPSPSARKYEVRLLQAGSDKPILLTTARPSVTLPPLGAGRYAWTVKALNEDLASAESAERSFEVKARKLKLEVRGAGWQ